jgi:RES domain
MPSVAKCCPNCFGDRGLGKSIIPAITSERGACSYCESQDVPLVAPLQLGDYFSVLVSIYVQADDGRQLIEWLREDWDLFHHPTMDNPRAKDLLAEVLDDGEIIRKTLVPSPKYHSDRQLRWERLRTELMHENRYFPAAQFDTERLRELLDHLQADDVPAVWHRARLQTDDAPYTIADMGAPPGRIASHGRANPAGIPYLYLGSTPQTAISEIRPHTGEKACVADFSVPAGLKLVDLRNPRRLVFPFVLRSDIAFLERLGIELTRPIVEGRTARARVRGRLHWC